MACAATPFGLRCAGHCLHRAHAQQSRWALIPAGGNQGVTSLRSAKSQGVAANYFVASRGLCRSEEHTSELQSLMRISYAVFCLKKKNHKSHSQSTIK